MRRRRLTAALLAPLLALPDVLPPGHRSVDHQLVFTLADTAASYGYALAPTRGFGGVVALSDGVETPFSTKYGSRVHALPAGVALPDDPATLADAAVASSAPPVLEVRSAPAWTLLARVRTHVAIEGVADGAVRMRVLRETRHDDFGVPLVLGVSPSAALAVAAGLALVVWAVRRRGRARAP